MSDSYQTYYWLLDQAKILKIGRKELAMLKEILYTAFNPNRHIEQPNVSYAMWNPVYNPMVFDRLARLGHMYRDECEMVFDKLVRLELLKLRDDKYYEVRTWFHDDKAVEDEELRDLFGPGPNDKTETKPKRPEHRGGARPGAGRPKKPDARRHTVSLKVSDDEREVLMTLGDGNMTKGLRSILNGAMGPAPYGPYRNQ